jgi:hypothetical protein
LTLTVTQTIGDGDAFLVEEVRDGHARVLLYDRSAQIVTVLERPELLVGRASWRDFDGDSEPILAEVGRLLENGGARS